MFQPKFLPGHLSEWLRSVGSPVVREQFPNLDALALEMGKRPLEKSCRGGLRLIRKDFHISRPGVVINGDVSHFPTRPAVAAGPITGNPGWV